MASYRLIDEQPGLKPKRLPWSPLGLFFLTFLYLPLSVPFWILNWGRLGQPQKRVVSGLAALGVFAVPFGLIAAQASVETVRLFTTLGKLAFAYLQLNGQRPLYDAHLERGGAKAAAWPLWVAAAAGVVLQFAL